MPVDEAEVYVTRDGHSRAAIVRRSDGHFCIYRHLRLEGSWMDDDNPVLLCYDDPDPEQVQQPLTGIYGTVVDARREVLSMPGFADALLARRHEVTDAPASIAPPSPLRR